MYDSKQVLTFGLLATLAGGTAAQEAAQPLDAVVVTGRRTPARLADTPQRIETISSSEIENTPARELTDVLKKNSSVDVIQYPGNLSGIGIRGFRPEYSGINKHALLLIDGRPAMSDNLSLVNMDQVQRIEVLKGPASALYGSSAMGGVINIITRESRGALHGQVQLGYGSYDTRQGKAAVGGAIDETLDFDYAGSLVDQGEDFKMGNGQVRPNTAYAQQHHALRLAANLAPDWRLSLNTDDYRGRDIATPGNIADGSNAQSNKDMDRHGADLKLTGQLGAHELMARLYGGRQSYELYTKTSTVASQQAYLPYRSFDARIAYEGAQIQDAWAWSAQASLVYGLDLDRAETLTRSYNPNGTRKAPSSANSRRHSTGLYAQNSWQFNRGDSTVYIGVRRDAIEVATLSTPLKTNFTPSTADFSNTSPSAGFKHLLGAGMRLHGTVGKGFVTPDAAYLTGSASATSGKVTTITQGNPALKPESSLSYDLGLEWSNPSVFVDLTAFATRVQDKIVNAVTTTSTASDGSKTNLSTYYNGSEAHMRGLEWNARWKANAAWQLGLAGTHYFVREEMISQAWSTVRNVPRNAARASVEYDQGGWSARLGLRHVGRWVDNNWTGDTSKYIEYAGFTTVDAALSYRVTATQTVALAVDNLTDRYYAEKGGYPLPGRNARLSWRLDI